MRFSLLQTALAVSALAVAAFCASGPPTLAQNTPANPLRLCADPSPHYAPR